MSSRGSIDVYLDQDHLWLLETLAKAAKMNRSQFIRRLIDDAFRTLVEVKYAEPKKAD